VANSLYIDKKLVAQIEAEKKETLQRSVVRKSNYASKILNKIRFGDIKIKFKDLKINNNSLIITDAIIETEGANNEIFTTST
jgi:hypothetical protein